MNEINFDTSGFKYVDESLIETIDLRNINNKRKEKKETIIEHKHPPLDFLKCKVCFEFLHKSEKFLGKKFGLLNYFLIDEN